MIRTGMEHTLKFSFSQEEVNAFAEVTGDNNPLHLDAEYAAKTAFKKPIMHGFLGGSVFSRILGTIFPGEGTIYLKQTMEFKRPMYVDTEYEAQVYVLIVDKAKNKAIIQTDIIDENGKSMISGEAMVLNKEKIV